MLFSCSFRPTMHPPYPGARSTCPKRHTGCGCSINFLLLPAAARLLHPWWPSCPERCTLLLLGARQSRFGSTPAYLLHRMRQGPWSGVFSHRETRRSTLWQYFERWKLHQTSWTARSATTALGARVVAYGGAWYWDSCLQRCDFSCSLKSDADLANSVLAEGQRSQSCERRNLEPDHRLLE